MDEYVRANIDKIAGINENDLTKLKGAFLENLRFKIVELLAQTQLKKRCYYTFIEFFEPPEALRALGIDEVLEQKLRADASYCSIK